VCVCGCEKRLRECVCARDRLTVCRVSSSDDEIDVQANDRGDRNDGAGVDLMSPKTPADGAMQFGFEEEED
jgi:hypothetical protein